MIALPRAAAAVLLLLPAALTVYLSFNGGGYFPDAIGIASLVVLQAIVLRITLADDPLAGFRAQGVVAVGALAAFGLWTLASQRWSDAEARALIEADRVLLYVLVLMLFASVPHTSEIGRAHV